MSVGVNEEYQLMSFEGPIAPGVTASRTVHHDALMI